MEAYFNGVRRPLGPEFDEFLDPRRTAVVSIDMHRGHLAADPDCPCPAPRAREIVAPIDAFHRSARAAGVPVVHVRTGLRPNRADEAARPAAWRLTFPMTVGPIPNHWAYAVEGSPWAEFVTEIAPEDHVVATKKRLSCFHATDLEPLLRNLRRDVVVLDGGFTDCCVLNAAFDASNRDFRVVVPRDLVRGFSPELEDAALRIISLHLGLVVDPGDLVEVWDGHGSHRPGAASRD